MSDATQQLIGANAAAAILGIPVKNGKPSGSVYDALRVLDCITVQLDGRAVKTWKRGDVEGLRHEMLMQQKTAPPQDARPVGRESNFGQWQHRVKALEQRVGEMETVFSDLAKDSKLIIAKLTRIDDVVDQLLYMWEDKK